MSIQNFIKKVCVQTAVYWGNPVNDGFGGKTFDAPIELKPPNGVRWEDKQRIVKNNQGVEQISNASILVTIDLQIEGWLYLGDLDSIHDSEESSSGDYLNPKKVNGAYEIIAFDKIPEVKSTDKFIRTAYLGK